MSTFTEIDYQTATIAAGAALSGAVNLGEKQLLGIYMPGAWTAADITLQSSPDGGTTFYELNATDGAAADAVAAFQVHAPAASQFVAIDPTKLRGVNCIKLRSGTAGSPVNQVAQAVLTLATRGVL